MHNSKFDLHNNVGVIGTWKFDQDAIRKASSKMVIVDELILNLLKGRASNISCLLHVLGLRHLVDRQSIEIVIIHI